MTIVARFSAALIAGCLAASPVLAKGGGHSSSHHSAQATRKAEGVPRDAKGRIQRDPQAKRDFQKATPCPSTGRTSGSCPGFVVDHVNPLKRGGADSPSNMQWQTTEAAKAKDKVE